MQSLLRMRYLCAAAMLIGALIAPLNAIPSLADGPVPQCAVAHTLTSQVVLVFNTLPSMVDPAAGACADMVQKGWSGVDYTADWSAAGYLNVCHVDIISSVASADLFAESRFDTEIARSSICQQLGQQYTVTYPDQVAAPPTPVPVPAAAPTAASVPSSTGKIEFVSSGWTQDKYGAVTYAFIVRNNVGAAVDYAQYQVAAYDRAGAVLKTDSGYLPVLSAGQRYGHADDMYLPDGTTAARLDVQISQGRPTNTNAPVLTASDVVYHPDRIAPKAAGIVHSQFNADLKEVRVSAIAYDAAGNIIGGGFSYLDFVPANGSAAKDVSIATSGTPAKIDFFPTVTSLSGF